MKFDSVNLPVKMSGNNPATGTAAGRDVGRLREKAVQFDFATNVFVGTIQLEGTIDGLAWFAIGAAVTTSGIVQVPYAVFKLRTNTTVSTSGGVAIVTCGGMDSRAK